MLAWTLRPCPEARPAYATSGSGTKLGCMPSASPGALRPNSRQSPIAGSHGQKANSPRPCSALRPRILLLGTGCGHRGTSGTRRTRRRRDTRGTGGTLGSSVSRSLFPLVSRLVSRHPGLPPPAKGRTLAFPPQPPSAEATPAPPQPVEQAVGQPEGPGEHEQAVDPQGHGDHPGLGQGLGGAVLVPEELGDAGSSTGPVTGNLHLRLAQQALGDRRREGAQGLEAQQDQAELHQIEGPIV